MLSFHIIVSIGLYYVGCDCSGFTKEEGFCQGESTVGDKPASKHVNLSHEDKYKQEKGAENLHCGSKIDKNTKEKNLSYVPGSPPRPNSSEQPKGPEMYEPATGAPLPEYKVNITGPKSLPLPQNIEPPKPDGGNILSSIVLLLNELDRLQTEVLTRYLNKKLKLVCVPLP